MLVVISRAGVADVVATLVRASKSKHSWTPWWCQNRKRIRDALASGRDAPKPPEVHHPRLGPSSRASLGFLPSGGQGLAADVGAESRISKEIVISLDDHLLSSLESISSSTSSPVPAYLERSRTPPWWPPLSSSWTLGLSLPLSCLEVLWRCREKFCLVEASSRAFHSSYSFFYFPQLLPSLLQCFVRRHFQHRK